METLALSCAAQQPPNVLVATLSAACLAHQLDRVAIARKQAAEPFAKPINADRSDKR
ncbi:hypothetical protein [Iodobacter sp. BJB302]|uniref:hypothetical protein n=1 Tax=Iodobacter sp. BJB302 TaxID=1506510 RepID=UPI0015D4C0B5|nr:hypothetical protein [Iodobacter sp. BJB302]